MPETRIALGIGPDGQPVPLRLTSTGALNVSGGAGTGPGASALNGVLLMGLSTEGRFVPLAVDADGNIQSSSGGGEGPVYTGDKTIVGDLTVTGSITSAGSIQKATLHLNNDQIKALGEGSYIAFPAPLPTQMLLCLGAIVQTHIVTGYTVNAVEASVVLAINNSVGTTGTILTRLSSGTTTLTDLLSHDLICTLLPIVIADASYGNLVANAGIPGNFAGRALYLQGYNGGDGPFGGGHADNTMDVSVFCLVGDVL